MVKWLPLAYTIATPKGRQSRRHQIGEVNFSSSSIRAGASSALIRNVPEGLGELRLELLPQDFFIILPVVLAKECSTVGFFGSS
jgi:hypothetical protein